ncbi:proteinase-activated receptor 1-like [Lineus longissimus]|uniref:proteinase-activated receptor 1-like n=1 Tax=Lineus longissimus TaxID=88925 RepID=UPI002B4D35F0
MEMFTNEPEETPVPPVTYPFMEFATEVLSKWASFFIVAIGIVGNTMSLLITTKKDNRRISTCVYMTALASVDTVVLINEFVHAILSKFPDVWKVMESSWVYLGCSWYFADVFAISSGLILAQMSIDRAIAVTYPMKASSICTASRAAKITIVSCIFEMCFHIQTFFYYKLPDIPNGVIILDYPNARWVETYYNVYLLIFGTIAPFSILVVCNTVIIFGIRKAAKERRRMKSMPTKTAKEPNLTTMLLMTSSFYLACSCPKRIYDNLTGYDLTNAYWSARYWLQWWVCNELWLLNFAINFYLYFLGGGRKFRRDAIYIFKILCSKRIEQ